MEADALIYWKTDKTVHPSLQAMTIVLWLESSTSCAVLSCAGWSIRATLTVAAMGETATVYKLAIHTALFKIGFWKAYQLRNLGMYQAPLPAPTLN